MPLLEQFPSPDLHDNWQSWARALLTSIESLAQQAVAADYTGYVTTTTPVDPGQLPPLPAGYLPVWLNTTEADLYLGNADYDPPTAPNIVFIDTQNLADAAIEVNKLADGAVESAKIQDATIASADIGNAAIISALIADLAVVNAKINDLAVNEAKIANLAVSSAKIANLAVGAAHIQVAAIENAHIAGTIQSAGWNPGTKQGWHIDKSGLIQGSGLAIYDSSGNLIFGSGAGQITSLAVNIFGQLTAVNLSTFMASAAIGTAFIQDAAITNALIGNLAVSSAQIQDLAVVSAKIADLTVGTTKIADDAVNADKINVSQLSAISAVVGLLRTATSGARLEIESNQIRVYYASGNLAVRIGVW